MKRSFAFSNFQKRILQPYLVIIVGGLVLFYTLAAMMVRGFGLKAAERNQVSMCMEVSQQLESFTVETRNVDFQMMMNSWLIQDFGTFSDDKVNDSYYGDHIIDHINAVSALTDTNRIQRIAARISVFNRYGDYVNNGVMPQSETYMDDVLHNRMDIDGIVSRLVLNDEYIYVEGPRPDYWNSKVGYEVISLYCPLGNKIQDDMYGIVEMQQDSQKLVQILLSGLDQDMAVLLFNSGGRCVFNSVEDIYPPEYYDFYCSQTSGNQDSRYGFNRIKVGNRAQEQYLSAGISEASGQMTVIVRSRSSIVSVMQDIQEVVVVAIFVFMVLSAHMACRVSLRMTKPINDMIASTQSTSWSNLDMEALGDNDENEIMALDNTFKKTLKRLSESTQLELGVRFSALQSQMSPHFLYNTLSVINASTDRQKKVERMCNRPSDILRYSTVYEEESNSALGGEVRHTESYLESMKDRYEENLIYDIEEAGDLGRVRVPGVILRPIVENCLKHGFGENGFSWIVHVAVTASDRHWKIHVRNNGRPFRERDLKELSEKVEGFLKGEQKKISGIGLTNTIIRLRLLYEERVGYEICTGNDGHTCVVLKGNYE